MRYLETLQYKAHLKTVLAFLFFILASVLHAQPQHTLRFYTVREGLSQNSVTALFRDSKGFLWVGSQDGLNRFDGVEFTRFRHDSDDETTISDQYITFIFEDIYGLLWIGTRNGLNTFDWSTQKFKRIYPDPTMKNKVQYAVSLIQSFSNGDLLLSISGTAFRYRHGDQSFQRLKDDLVFPSSFALAGDELWQVIDENHVCRPAIENSHVHRGLGGNLQLAVDANKNIWAAFPNGPDGTRIKIFSTKEKKWLTERIDLPVVVNQISFDVKGTAWVASGKGIYQLLPDMQLLSWPARGISTGTEVLCLLQDRDGFFWVGLGNNGLGLFNPETEAFQLWETGLPNDPIFCAVENPDGIFLVGAQSGLYRFTRDGKRLSKWLDKKCRSVAIGGKEEIWVGTDGAGLFRLNSVGNITGHWTNTNSALPGKQIFSVLPSKSDGLVYVCTDGGLMLMNKGGKTLVYHDTLLSKTGPHLSGNYVLNAFQDSKKNIWISTNTGIDVLKGASISSSFHTDSDTSNHIKKTIVTGVKEDGRGNFWITTLSNGVYHKTGAKFTQYKGASAIAYGSAMDSAGRVWVTTSDGMMLIDPASEKVVSITADNGLPASDFSIGSISSGPSGLVFAGSPQGLVVINPKFFEPRESEPSVHLTSASLNYEPVPISSSYLVGQDTRIISFGFSAPVFINAEKLLFQYRLIGFQNDWITLPDQERRITFTNLPFSQFRLELRAAHSADRLPISAVLRVDITRQPPWWLNRFVQVPILILGFMALGLIIRNLSRRKLKEKIRKSDLEKRLSEERERLSRDLHDRLGAYAAAIKNNIHHLEKSEGGTDRLTLLKENAEQMVNALRETIWALQHQEVSLISLSDRLKSHINRIAVNFPETRIQVLENLKTEHFLSPTQGIHLLSILQEAITNALRHSGATSIIVEFNDQPEFRMVVRDNGQGFSSSSVAGGYGLENMKQRAQEAGFMLEISSQPTGTHVAVRRKN